eukprot:SAG31_NODE_290_length_18324_cov_33.408889_13_plen_468_part_00
MSSHNLFACLLLSHVFAKRACTERKHAVIWPREHGKKKHLRKNPLLFLFDSETANKPHRVVTLAGTVLSNPTKLHRDFPHAFRLGPPGGEKSADSVTLCAGTASETAEWRDLLMNLAHGETVLQLRQFGVPLEDLMAQQREITGDATGGRVELAVPAILLDTTRRLSELGCHTTEGIFRVPGESAAIQQLKRKYEAGSLFIDDDHEVAVWASLLKLWLRELPEPLINNAIYDAAMTIATSYLAKTKEGMAANTATTADVAVHVAQMPAHVSEADTRKSSHGLILTAVAEAEREDAECDSSTAAESGSDNIMTPVQTKNRGKGVVVERDVVEAHMQHPPARVQRRKSVFAAVEDLTVELAGQGAALAQELGALLEALPELHRKVLEVLLGFLRQVDPTATRMTAHSIAIIFAPCCFRNVRHFTCVISGTLLSFAVMAPCTAVLHSTIKLCVMTADISNKCCECRPMLC